MVILEQNSEAMLVLEALVDKVGMRNVVYALGQIAGAKADHIRADWQDIGFARMWQNNANKLDRYAAGLTRIYGDPE
jgi:hypothetical protein